MTNLKFESKLSLETLVFRGSLEIKTCFKIKIREQIIGKQKFSIEFKLEVIGKYEMGTCGYKKLAKMYGLSRDTVRSWVLNPKLNPKKNSEEETTEQ